MSLIRDQIRATFIILVLNRYLGNGSKYDLVDKSKIPTGDRMILT